ncbi:MAG TPA: DegQ family serine endoprotease [Pyrinomonadaceae bacterium]|jgi:Do/DeqQ family serine protease|nr:DegQ family serine endoprotease [Pyrinomonadaceae bacterium]
MNDEILTTQRTPRTTRGLARLACALVVSFIFVGCNSVGSKATEMGNPQLNFAPGTAATGAPATAAQQNSYADVVARVAPAVVTVRSERRGRAAQQHPFMDDPMFREFFGQRIPNMPQTPRREEGLGSGVIVTADGYLLTNHHVVDGADEIRVELSDRRVLTAKIVGSDPPSDLAVLKIEASNLPVLPLGDSDKVRVGDMALAVGNPLGIGQTVTAGIISAKERTTSGVGDGSFANFIQTDAPINRGNSGGALVNTNGELIGINSQILSPTGGSIGIGFAIPSNMAKGVMEQLVKGGKVRRGQLGVQIQEVTSDIAASLDLKEVRGVIIGAVTPGSAGERAGLKQGDVITAVGGAPVNDVNSLRNRIASTAPGTDVTLTVVRDGREQQVRATLGEFTQTARREGDESGSDQGGAGTPGEATGKLGVRVQPLTPEVAREFEVEPGTQGVAVADVDPSGPAADAGIQRGDVIVQANRQPVRSSADLTAAVGRTGTRPALLLVNRRGNTIFLTVRPRA